MKAVKTVRPTKKLQSQVHLKELKSWENMGMDEQDAYIRHLESGFEDWGKAKRRNKRLSEENSHLKNIIDQLLSQIESMLESKDGEKNSDKIVHISLEIIRKYFIPNMSPNVVKEKLNLYSARLVVKKTEEYGLFKFPELVVRVARTKKVKGKYETTVLYSSMGVIVLNSLIEREIKKQHSQVPFVSDKEQEEIEKMFTPAEKKRLLSHRGKTLKDYEIIKTH